jgi:hypothetical protein
MAEVNELPFTIKIYDKNFNFEGFVGDPVSLVITPRFNQTGTGVLVVETDHRMAPALLADGARFVIDLRGEFLMSGKINRRNAEGPSVDGTLTVYLKDDFRLLHQILGYPVPGAALTAQTSEYATYTGTAEAIVKNVVSDNMISRLGMDVVCPTNLGRGSTVPDGVAFRFHPLYERLFPAVEQAGIGVTFKQSGSSIVCDVFEPPVFERTLDESSGVITSWTWNDEDPTATHVVAGGQGEGTARIFRDVRNSSLESAHNDVVEVFQDARDADTAAIVSSRAQEGLDDGAPRSGFAVHLSETEHFQYGKDGLVVGAQVTISIGLTTRTDILREVTLSYTRDEGLVTTPTVGDIQDSPDRIIANFLARLKKGITDLKVSK